MGQNGGEVTPLPMKKISALGLLLLTNNASIWMVFAFLPFMVLHFYPDISEVEIGYRAGILGSAFSLGGLFGSFMWGVLADRIGRRPVLMLGLVGTAAAATIFGFAPNYWVAILARFLWGFLNGNVGVGKTYMAEIVDDSNNAKGMAVFGVIGGLGRIMGPILGGFLSSPADHYAVFKGTIFETYPFALPSVVVVAVCIVSLITAYFTLPETWSADSGPYMQLVTRGEEEGDGGDDIEEGTALDVSEHSPNGDRDTRSSGSGGADQCAKRPTVIETARNGKTMTKHNEDSGGVELTDTGGGVMIGATRGILSRLSAGRAGFTHVRSANALLDGDTDLTSGLLGDGEMEGHIADDEMVESSPTTPVGCKKKRSVFFNGAVQIKVIDTDVIEYRRLKEVTKQDRPVYTGGNSGVSRIDCGGDDDDDDVETVTLIGSSWSSGRGSTLGTEDPGADAVSEDVFKAGGVRYTNGSELIGEDDVRVKYSSLWAKLADLRSKRMVTISTSLYGLISLMHIIVVEVFPLWLVVPVDSGGFGFSAYSIGLTLTVSGPVALFSQLIVYPYLVDRYGSVKVFRNGVATYGLCCLVMPLVALIRFKHSLTLSMCSVAALYAVASSVIGWSFVSVFVLINNSCYSHQRGTVNGIGQTMASAGRLVGPIAGSSLFAWSESNHLQWPFNYALVWMIVFVMAVYIYRLSFRLPRKILKKRREPKVPRYAVTMEQRKGATIA